MAIFFFMKLKNIVYIKLKKNNIRVLVSIESFEKRVPGL